MTPLFQLTIDSETLTHDELSSITGCGRRADQVSWLDAQGWTYVKTRSGEPVVGRLYARLRLAGISPSALVSPGGWTPDFSSLR